MPKRGTTSPQPELQTLGEMICFLRERAMLTQRDLAARVGYHYSYISRIEKNQHSPDTATLMGRFIPALEIQSEPEWAERLLALASPKEPESIASPPEKQAVHEAKVYRPPVSLTAMFGRESEIAQIIQSLQRPEVRIFTLIGPPGVGKTRLASQVAEQLAAHFSNGAVFVNLAPIAQPELVLTALGEALGVHESSDTSIQSVLETFLQKKNLLIVMDNFEQVLSAAPELTRLLPRAPGVKILATSREALRVQGEHEFHLEPLPLPTDIHAQTYVLLTSPAIQLFVQRARAVQGVFELTDENAARVAEICLRLDGLPLAIELAAARIQTLSPAAMLQQFERRFDWLTRSRSDVPARRQTLSGAIKWSYQLLSEPERALFQRLSVFEGSWDLEAVERICSDEVRCPPDEIFNTLLLLSDRSLVVVEAQETGTRYRYLETIRHFAREKLADAGEQTELQNRHLSYFTEWAEQMAALMHKMPPLEFRRAVEQEHNNLHAGLRWALSTDSTLMDGFRLAASISTVWLKLSYFKQALDWVNAYLLKATLDTYKPQRARLLYLKAALSYWRDHLTDALDSALEAETLARELDDQVLLANILYYLGGSIYRELGEYTQAEACLQESIVLCRENNLRSRLSIALTSFGILLSTQGDQEAARAALEEAQKIATLENDRWGLGYALRAQADHLRLMGSFAEALALYKRAFEISLAIDDRISTGIELANMSLLANVLEEYPLSIRYAEAALSIFQTIGNEYQQPFPQRMLAYAALHTGDLNSARAFCSASLLGNQKIDHRTGMLACLLVFAEIEAAAGNMTLAARVYQFVKTQQTENSLQFMEPDHAALQRLESQFRHTAAVQVDVAGLTMTDLLSELELKTQ